MTDVLYILAGAATVAVVQWVVDRLEDRRVIARCVLRNYWDESRTHRPYVGILHDVDDPEKQTSIDRLLVEVTRFAYEPGADGRTLEIVVTGDPRVGGTWQLTEPHIYSLIDRNRLPYEPEAAP